MPGLKERAKTLKALAESASFLWLQRPLSLDSAAEALLKEDARGRLAAIIPRLERIEPWDAGTLEEAVRTFAEAQNVKLGVVAQPIRAALTGRAVSPPIFDVLAVLGRDEALARLRDQAR
jgi:glutamyl-tRNA synthetase